MQYINKCIVYLSYDHILYNSFHRKCSERQIYGNRKWISDCLGLGGMKGPGVIINRYRVYLGVD